MVREGLEVLVLAKNRKDTPKSGIRPVRSRKDR
jgi:hypothetical protein